MGGAKIWHEWGYDAKSFAREIQLDRQDGHFLTLELNKKSEAIYNKYSVQQDTQSVLMSEFIHDVC